METSPTIGNIATALSAAQGAIKPAVFNKTNPHFKSRYADLSSVIETSRKPLSDNGLAVAQSVTSDDLKVIVETWLTHKSGEFFKAQTVLKASKADPQGVGSAMTYAKRYAWCAMLGISADDDDDDDANGASGPPSQRPVDAKPTTNARSEFGRVVKEWSGVNAEDAVAAAREAAKKLGVTNTKEVPADDWPRLVAALANAKDNYGTFSEWIASTE